MNAISVSYSGAVLWKQGKVDDQLVQNLGRITPKPLDPLSSEEYTYAVTYDRSEFQIAAGFESDNISYAPLVEQANASFKYAIVKGNYNGKMIGKGIGPDFYVFGVPSIITTSDTDITLLDIISQKKFVYNGFRALPP